MRVSKHKRRTMTQDFATDAQRCQSIIGLLAAHGYGVDDIKVKLKLQFGIACERAKIKAIVLGRTWK